MKEAPRKSFYGGLASAAATGLNFATTAANVGIAAPVLVAGAAVGISVGVGKLAVDATRGAANATASTAAEAGKRLGLKRTLSKKKLIVTSDAGATFNDDLASSLSEAAGDDIVGITTPIERGASSRVPLKHSAAATTA